MLPLPAPEPIQLRGEHKGFDRFPLLRGQWGVSPLGCFEAMTDILSKHEENCLHVVGKEREREDLRQLGLVAAKVDFGLRHYTPEDWEL